jgi:uncharacterized protein (TIGR02271 family)
MAYETTTRTAVTAYFKRRSNAEAAIDELEQNGFTHAQISLAVRPEYGTTDTEGSSYSTGHDLGQKTGSMWGKIVNFFEGKDAGNATTSTAGTPGAAYDSTGTNSVHSGYDYNSDEFQGSLDQLNVSKDHARYFGHHFSQGEEGAIVTVNAPERAEEAEQILEKNSGDIGRNAADFEYPSALPTAAATETEATQRVQLLGEILRVHKDRVQRGEVILRKNVVTENQTFQVPVQREELVITRTPVTGSASATSGTIGGENEIRIPLSEERVRITKENTILEEVSIGKRELTDNQTVTDSVRHEELSVDENRAELNEETSAKPRY